VCDEDEQALTLLITLYAIVSQAASRYGLPDFAGLGKWFENPIDFWVLSEKPRSYHIPETHSYITF